MELIEDS